MKPTTALRKICGSGGLIKRAELYVTMCRDSASKNSFPNLAGFARSLGVGLGDLEKICGKYPEQYDAVLALLEDEALNCGQSPTILSAYLKERLDFGEKKEGGASENGAERLKIVFEHDISEDGGWVTEL